VLLILFHSSPQAVLELDADLFSSFFPTLLFLCCYLSFRRFLPLGWASFSPRPPLFLFLYLILPFPLLFPLPPFFSFPFSLFRKKGPELKPIGNFSSLLSCLFLLPVLSPSFSFPLTKLYPSFRPLSPSSTRFGPGIDLPFTLSLFFPFLFFCSCRFFSLFLPVLYFMISCSSFFFFPPPFFC